MGTGPRQEERSASHNEICSWKSDSNAAHKTRLLLEQGSLVNAISVKYSDGKLMAWVKPLISSTWAPVTCFKACPLEITVLELELWGPWGYFRRKLEQ